MDVLALTKLAEFLQSAGPWGLTVIAFFVITVLYRDGVALRAQIAQVHEKRVVDVALLAEKTANGLASSNATTAAQAVATESSNRILEQILDVVKVLPPALEVTSRQLDNNANRIDQLKDMLRGGHP